MTDDLIFSNTLNKIDWILSIYNVSTIIQKLKKYYDITWDFWEPSETSDCYINIIYICTKKLKKDITCKV